MRLLGHNGEINTLVGNINWMMAREADLHHDIWGDRLENCCPLSTWKTATPPTSTM
jgi:glutamate synthase (ferredoxin)